MGKRGPKARPLHERLAQYQEKRGDDECWGWRGAVTEHGYGRLAVPGRGVDRAHRIAFVIAHGPIPEGMVVMHTCDCPPCTNPAHLVAGTQGDNQRDKAEKGRSRNGQMLRTTCPRGHAYDLVRADGRRGCLTCRRDTDREAKRGKRARLRAGVEVAVSESLPE